MSAPWTRQEQINYSVFGTREAPPEWDVALAAVFALGRATGCPIGQSLVAHFEKLWASYEHASMSVD